MEIPKEEREAEMQDVRKKRGCRWRGVCVKGQAACWSADERVESDPSALAPWLCPADANPR